MNPGSMLVATMCGLCRTLPTTAADVAPYAAVKAGVGMEISVGDAKASARFQRRRFARKAFTSTRRELWCSGSAPPDSCS